MAFGRRKVSKLTFAAERHSRADNGPSTFDERIDDLRSDIRRINREAISLARIVKQGWSLEPPYSARAEAIHMHGFARHFDHAFGGVTKHDVYVYLTSDGRTDRQAQLDLFRLAARISYINMICRSCSDRDELRRSLRDAQHSIDFVIAMSAFFAAYFESLARAVAHVTGAAEGERSRFDVREVRNLITASLDGAKAACIEPKSFMAHVPEIEWPVMGGALEVEDHEGQVVLENVYLPADLANDARAMSLMLDQLPVWELEVA